MKVRTASRLLSIAFKEGDEDAARLACAEKPWELLDHSNDREFRFHPIYDALSLITNAKANRDGSVDPVRKATANCLQMMIEHGYRPKIDQLNKLAETDAYVFTKVLRSLMKLEDPVHPHLLHYLMTNTSPAAVISKVCLKLGFDPNTQDANGNTLLHAMWEKACSVDSMKSMVSESTLWWDHTDRLVASGAQLSTPSPRGATVLSLICRAIDRGVPGATCKEAWAAAAEAQQLKTMTPPTPLSSLARRI